MHVADFTCVELIHRPRRDQLASDVRNQPGEHQIAGTLSYRSVKSEIVGDPTTHIKRLVVFVRSIIVHALCHLHDLIELLITRPDCAHLGRCDLHQSPDLVEVGGSRASQLLARNGVL
ncbi:hypothetical protein RNC47_37150, partial [Streptomyces sp. DSM 44918]